MTTPAKLAAFGAVLALAFGAAALAGGAVEPLRGASAPAEDDMAMEGAAVRGLAVTDDAFALQLDQSAARPGRRFELAFRIRDERGLTVRDFDVEHTKRMHVIVVRRDMTDFQHIHPVEGSDGTWRVPLTLHSSGSYRVFADVSVDSTPHTLADDLSADGRFESQSLPPAKALAVADGYRIQLVEGAGVHAADEAALRFAITRHGRPVHVQDYLGAKGHLVALRQGDLAYLHVHPDAESLTFEATFPSVGRYRLFLQFKVGGRVHTAAFTQEVTE